MRIVLTGAAGLLGSHLVAVLGERYEIVPVDREPVDHPRARRLDLADLDGLAEACEGADALCHFGGASAVESPWEDVLSANLVGTYHAFEAARRAGVERVLFASSNHAVGGYEVEAGASAYRGALLLDRHTEPRPDSLYGASKLFGEGLGRFYADRYGLRVLCLRIAACIPDDDFDAASARPRGWLALGGEPERRERVASMWLSRRDLVQIVEKGLEADYRYACVYAVSGNATRFLDIEEARRVLGYVPLDAGAP